MISDNNCTVLVSSYDRGEDLWNGFFTLYKKYWNNNFPIVLNTESKKYSFDGLNIKTFNIFNSNSKVSWAKRLKKTLEKIDTDYIIFLLEDYWFEKEVDNTMINKSLEWIKKDNNIACFYFQPIDDDNNIDSIKYPFYQLRPKKGPYIFNCQAALWDRKKLMKLLRFHESAWDWELYGSLRSSKFPYDFYTLKPDKQPPFQYHRGLGGVVHGGKWIRNIVEPISEKHNIKIDFDKRGYIYETKESFIKKPSTLYEKVLKPHFFVRLSAVIKSKIHKFLSTI